jgi:hypothetical protein
MDGRGVGGAVTVGTYLTIAAPAVFVLHGVQLMTTLEPCESAKWDSTLDVKVPHTPLAGPLR